MFPDSSTESAPAASKAKRQHGILIYILAGLIVLLAGAAGFLGYRILATPNFIIPKQIVKDAGFPIFVPKKLPGSYQIINGSFAVAEETTLLFQAKDPTGSSIAFSEQKRLGDFDFDAFYKNQMVDAKRLDGTPYSSYVGRSPDGGKWLLSVVTDDTWVLASTGALLSEQDFTTIAESLGPY